LADFCLLQAVFYRVDIFERNTLDWTFLGAILLGAAFVTIFQGALNYLVDTFQACPASAVAASTTVRSIITGAFPLFTNASSPHLFFSGKTIY
jgi:hypothetical protein